MEHLNNNVITYWYFYAFFAFIAITYLRHLWHNRISNTHVAVTKQQKLFARFHLDLQCLNEDISMLSIAVDSTVKFHSAVNFPNREVLLVMESLKRLRKAARSFYWFGCRYRILIIHAPRLFDNRIIHDQLLTAERQANEVMETLNKKLNY